MALPASAGRKKQAPAPQQQQQPAQTQEGGGEAQEAPAGPAGQGQQQQAPKKKKGGFLKKVAKVAKSAVKVAAPVLGKLGSMIPARAECWPGWSRAWRRAASGIKGVLGSAIKGAIPGGGVAGMIKGFAGKAVGAVGGKGGGVFSFIGQATKGKVGFSGAFEKLGLGKVMGGGLLNKARGVMARLKEVNPGGLGKVGEFMTRIQGKFSTTFSNVTSKITGKLEALKAKLPADKRALVDEVVKETKEGIETAQQETNAAVVTQQAVGELPKEEQKAADADNGLPAGTKPDGTPDVPAKASEAPAKEEAPAKDAPAEAPAPEGGQQ
jgi:hypothetical protein